jgi:hypothetical protein
LRSFAAKISQTVEATVKSEFPRARVWSSLLVVSSLNDAFVWNYLEAFAQLILNGSAANVAASFSLLYENTSSQIQSYQAIDCSSGRRSHGRFFARPICPGDDGSLNAHGS